MSSGNMDWVMTLRGYNQRTRFYRTSGRRSTSGADRPAREMCIRDSQKHARPGQNELFHRRSLSGVAFNQNGLINRGIVQIAEDLGDHQPSSGRENLIALGVFGKVIGAIQPGAIITVLLEKCIRSVLLGG